MTIHYGVNTLRIVASCDSVAVVDSVTVSTLEIGSVDLVSADAERLSGGVDGCVFFAVSAAWWCNIKVVCLIGNKTTG